MDHLTLAINLPARNSLCCPEYLKWVLSFFLLLPGTSAAWCHIWQNRYFYFSAWHKQTHLSILLYYLVFIPSLNKLRLFFFFKDEHYVFFFAFEWCVCPLFSSFLPFTSHLAFPFATPIIQPWPWICTSIFYRDIFCHLIIYYSSQKKTSLFFVLSSKQPIPSQ